MYFLAQELKKTVIGQKAEMTDVNQVQKLVDRQKQATDPTTQQLVTKLRPAASDVQIRYNRVFISALTTHDHRIFTVTSLCDFFLSSNNVPVCLHS